MKELILYTEKECVDCVDVKKMLNNEKIKFTSKDLMEKSEDLANQYPNKWEHIDLVKEYGLPPWVPVAVIKEGDSMVFVCSSNKTGNKGNIHIAETSELLFEKIKELL
tara:strand:+ start:6852 stop:7175 length:324 start_codon:yes stop_codon:yes gene_type:complete